MKSFIIFIACSTSYTEPSCYIEDGKTWIQCSEGLYRVGEYCFYSIDDGVPNCVEGSDVGKCTKCQQGYGLKSNKCEKCEGVMWSDGTKECQSLDNCEAMADNVSGKCVKCEAGFGLSSDETTCTECTGNTWSDGSKECQNGPDNCSESDHTVNECQKCNAGYGLQSNACLKCTNGAYSNGETECITIDNCLTAEDNINNKCQTCAPGYILNTDNTGCDTCSYGDTSDGVNACYNSDEMEVIKTIVDQVEYNSKTECTIPAHLNCGTTCEVTCNPTGVVFEIGLNSLNQVSSLFANNNITKHSYFYVG